VLAWKPGQAMRREAFVVVRRARRRSRAVVDVNGKKLVSWTEVKGVQPKEVLPQFQSGGVEQGSEGGPGPIS
jgi:primary-amine oxidase